MAPLQTLHRHALASKYRFPIVVLSAFVFWIQEVNSKSCDNGVDLSAQSAGARHCAVQKQCGHVSFLKDGVEFINIHSSTMEGQLPDFSIQLPDGLKMKTHSPQGALGRGFILVVMSNDGVPVEAVNFDTHKDYLKTVDEAMISYLNDLVNRHPGKIVMLAVADSANNGNDISGELYWALRSVLSAKALADKSIGLRASYALISRLGSQGRPGELLSEAGPSPEIGTPVSTNVCAIPKTQEDAWVLGPPPGGDSCDAICKTFGGHCEEAALIQRTIHAMGAWPGESRENAMAAALQSAGGYSCKKFLPAENCDGTATVCYTSWCPGGADGCRGENMSGSAFNCTSCTNNPLGIDGRFDCRLPCTSTSAAQTRNLPSCAARSPVGRRLCFCKELPVVRKRDPSCASISTSRPPSTSPLAVKAAAPSLSDGGPIGVSKAERPQALMHWFMVMLTYVSLASSWGTQNPVV